MKAIKIFLLLLILSAGVAHAQFTKAELQLNGLNCALCAKSTEKTLKRLPFVSDVKPDLMRNLFVITFKSGEAVNFDDIIKSVHDAGFFISSFKATFNFDGVKVTDSHFNYGTDIFQVMNTPAKPVAGETMMLMVDKGFAPRSVSKKYLGELVETPANVARVYHVAI
jgi:copper chaperone CopZ